MVCTSLKLLLARERFAEFVVSARLRVVKIAGLKDRVQNSGDTSKGHSKAVAFGQGDTRMREGGG